MNDMDFDMQAAWLRRFNADAESNLRAFALRIKEAMPELVTVSEHRGLFAKSGKITGVSLEIGEQRYRLELDRGRLKAAVAMVVRGVTLNTKEMPPAEWFARLIEETKKMSEHAESLSRSLSSFMAG